MSSTAGIVVFVVSLLAAIMLHEWGHLASARRFGIRADRYFLGFGPTLWSTRRGETEYGVKALPFGGFVTIKGMTPLDERLRPLPEAAFSTEELTRDRRRAAQRADGADPLEVGTLPEPTWERLSDELRDRGVPTDVRERIVRRTRASTPVDADPARARAVLTEVVVTEVDDTGRVGDLRHRLLKGDEGRFFHDRPAWQRAIVLAAGSAMHFAIAIVVLLGALLVLPVPTAVDVEPVVAGVAEGSAAAAAGLEEGDELLAVGDTASDDFRELQAAIEARAGEETTLTIRRDGQQRELVVTPSVEEDAETGETVGRVGFYPVQHVEEERLGPGEALRETFVGQTGVLPMTGATFRVMGQVFTPQGLATIAQQAVGDEERDAETGVVSLVGAADLAGQTEAFGPFMLILLIASINIFIGIFNLVPLPPLDGGHLAVLAVERTVNLVRGLRGRPQDFTVDPRAIAAIAVPVITVLVLLFVALLWLDITEPIQLPE